MWKRPLVIILVFFILIGSVNSAYAQFWKKWFNKDDQTQKTIPAKEDKASERETKDDKTIEYKTAEEAVEKRLTTEYSVAPIAKTDMVTIHEQKVISQTAVEETRREAESETMLMPGISDKMNDKEREESLRRTQEQVDQIRKIQEFNNSQRSLDNIKRINEMNRQQKRIDDINKFNKQQKNLDNLRQLNDTKK